MATQTTGWKCTHKAEIISETATTATIRVTCYWKNDGWTYDVNYVSAWVYCGNSSYKVKDSGSVYAKSSTSQSVSMGRHDFTVNKTTAAQSISCYAKIDSDSSYAGDQTKNSTAANISVSAKTSYTVSYNANGGSGQPSNQTKWYGTALTLSKTAPKRTGYSFQGWGTSANGSVVYKAGASYTANAAVTLYAVWKANTYTVSYNANGGSGQPGNQTKTYGLALTLSSDKPSKTGHTFVSWNTKADGTGTAYAPGSSYAGNAALTLYAIWKKNTYPVKYDANGGTNAPGNQTKTYGETLKLSSTVPKRTDYTFKGWATSKTGSVVYASGANYTANADVTLYAVWELSYEKPTISSYSVTRCTKTDDNTYVTADDGAYARVKFNWTSSVANPTALIEWQETAAKSESWTLSGTGGTVDKIIGGSFSTEKSYSIKATVNDSKDPQSLTRNLPAISFPIDIKAGGKGVAIGKAAEFNDHLDVGFNARFRKSSMFGEKTGYHDGKTGVYINPEGYMHIQRSSAEGFHPYLGFYIDGSTEADGQVRVNSSTGQMEFLSADGYKFGNHIYTPKGVCIYGISPNDAEILAFEAQNQHGHTTIGYGNYVNASGNTSIYGNDVYIASAAAGNASYKPYYRKGDTISLSWLGAGFITSGKTQLCFCIPLAKPVIGNPTITVASTGGFILRQNDKYTHGSNGASPTVRVIPSSYGTPTLVAGNFIKIAATMSDLTNAVNNSPIGIDWVGTITFE